MINAEFVYQANPSVSAIQERPFVCQRQRRFLDCFTMQSLV